MVSPLPIYVVMIQKCEKPPAFPPAALLGSLGPRSHQPRPSPVAQVEPDPTYRLPCGHHRASGSGLTRLAYARLDQPPAPPVAGPIFPSRPGVRVATATCCAGLPRCSQELRSRAGSALVSEAAPASPMMSLGGLHSRVDVTASATKRDQLSPALDPVTSSGNGGDTTPLNEAVNKKS